MNINKQLRGLMKYGLLLIVLLLLIPLIHAALTVPACEYDICREFYGGACTAIGGDPYTTTECSGGSLFTCGCAIYVGSPNRCSEYPPISYLHVGDKSCCIDECTVVGSTCSGGNLVNCGQNDGDPCLELTTTICQYGCENNMCNSPPPPTQCSNNADDDGDGLVDLNDPGCSNLYDNTEKNNEPIPRCGDGVIGIPAWGLSNNCQYIFEQCDDGNTVSGDGCSSTCQLELINITNIAYSYGTGCNSATKICGRNSQIAVTVSFPGRTAPAGTNSSVKVKNTPQPGFQECIITPTTIIATNKTNSLTFSYTILPSAFLQTGCQYNPLMNHTYDSKLLENNVPISNIFDNVFIPGFRLNECGDGQVDYIPSAVPPINESCDTINPGSNVWMTAECAGINSTHPGGTATCNQNTCKWNMSSCYRCGDGNVNPGEACDDGNNNNYDLCNNTCQKTTCGDVRRQWPNGVYQNGTRMNPYYGPWGYEECDDGNFNQYDRCMSNCTYTFCGDTRIQSPNGVGLLGGNITIYECPPSGCPITYWGYETCDDGNSVNNDRCYNCLNTTCGDGIPQWPNGVYKNGTFTYNPYLGYNSWGFEQCDDGNKQLTDTCANNCTLTFCGDNILQEYGNGAGTGGRLDDGKEECDNRSDPNCVNCVLYSCGNGKIDPGEECDDGGVCSEEPTRKCTDDSFCQDRDSGICITKSGDGCSATCKATNCSINQVTLSGCAGGVCGKGNTITVSTYFSGSNCSLANRLQADYLNLSLADGDCMIQYEPVGGQLQGMNATFSASRSPFTFNYIVPSINDLCAGKGLNFVTASLTQKFGSMGSTPPPGIIRTNNDTYSFNVASTKFDQCREFGETFNYTNYGVDTGYDVILNANTNCYYQTCSNYDARNVLFIDERDDYGVRLWNASKNDYDDYMCSTDIEDNICPDDFQYESSCRDGELSRGGVCANNRVKDADCELKTPMKCGITWNGTVMVNTCNVPLFGNPPTPPSKYCGDTSMCVYANELTGENKVCVGVNQTLQNAINKTIWCSNYNYFCPVGYQHNGTHCYNPIRQCVDKCPDVVPVSIYASDPTRLKTYAVWQSYINDADCFLKNTETNRRRAYCGIGYAWPAINYHYLPIGVSYWIIGISGEILPGGSDPPIGGVPIIIDQDQ